MRTARLLSDRKDCTDQYCYRQHAAGELRARAEDHEIERHQREAGGSMRTGIAVATRHRVRAVAEQPDIRTGPAVVLEVARTIDIRYLFQGTGCRRAEQKARDQKGRGPSQAGEPHLPEARHQRAKRCESGNAHEPDAARVDKADRPPGVRAEPDAGPVVIEPRVGDAHVEPPDRDRRQRCNHKHARYQCVAHPESPVRVHHQKLCLVWITSCALPSEVGPSSGKAMSMCSTLPSEERVLPSRRPRPMSFSNP